MVKRIELNDFIGREVDLLASNIDQAFNVELKLDYLITLKKSLKKAVVNKKAHEYFKDDWYHDALTSKVVLQLLNDFPKLHVNDISISEDGSIQHKYGFYIEGYKTMSYQAWLSQ